MISKPITTEQITALKAMGYTVENMGEEWGAAFDGEWRWIKGEEFQDDFTLPLAIGAWERAQAHAENQAGCEAP